MKISSILTQIKAFVSNVVSYFISFFQSPKFLDHSRSEKCCVVITGPGGLEKFQIVDLSNVQAVENGYLHKVSVGYNVPGHKPPITMVQSPTASIEDSIIDDDLCIVHVLFYSVNYADICIRWGLYESAVQYVGYPIVPGFDFSGKIVAAGKNSPWRPGDYVFGFTMFGSYSTHLLVPSNQIAKAPNNIPLEELASLVAVMATALHACALTKSWPGPILSANKSALIHSAAGGVGSMLVQICKLQGYTNVVGVVGSFHKVDYCRSLGADHVIDKSSVNLWEEAKKASPNGYAAVFDANGIETLADSYHALCRCGHLVSYGFHTNLPKLTSYLSPMDWFRMVYKIIFMPKFEPMDLVLESKSVSGFNLSFFADEKELISVYMKQLVSWMSNGSIRMPKIELYDMVNIAKAHENLQSGKTIGKCVVRTDC